jgi:hypothetical protein
MEPTENVKPTEEVSTKVENTESNTEPTKKMPYKVDYCPCKEISSHILIKI